MSGFTPTTKYEVDFDGDHLTFVLTRLKIKDQIKIIHATGTSSENIDKWYGLMDVGRSILPEYIVSMDGLTISGQPVKDFKVILEEAYFLPLVDLVLSELMKISRVQKEDEKNLSGPPENTLKE